MRRVTTRIAQDLNTLSEGLEGLDAPHAMAGEAHSHSEGTAKLGTVDHCEERLLRSLTCDGRWLSYHIILADTSRAVPGPGPSTRVGAQLPAHCTALAGS